MERFTIRSTHKLVSVALALLMLCSSRVNAGSFSASGSTLTLDLDVASQLVTVVATSTTYTFTLSGGATNTWSGTTSSSVSVSGAELTVTATGMSTFSTIIITDSQTGNAVTFNTSGSNVYADHITITLDNTPGALTFNGSSSFSGSNALTVTTSGYISLASGASLSTVDGSLTLEANMQAISRNFAYSGIMVDNATVQITGTGVLTMRGKGGSTGAALSYLNRGIAVINGGQVIGGTTGTTTIEGRGYTGVSGSLQGQGVLVFSAAGATTVSRISSSGSNVSVTGYGSNKTGAGSSGEVNAGVVLGGPSSSATTQGGIISAGGSGTVTITGYGGTTANVTTLTKDTHSHGVYMAGSATSITSGGGAVSVTGTAGGADSLSNYDYGVNVASGSISAGTNGNVTVTGTGGPGKGNVSNNNGGVFIQLAGSIKAGAGTGLTLVTGYGGGQVNRANARGVHLSGSVIGSNGSGNVTVIGYGGGLNSTGSHNDGIYLISGGSISSNGGDVRVEGTGGGGPRSGSNVGISLRALCTITAGGSGTVTVIGTGGNMNGTTGDTNHGVTLTANAFGDAGGYITSSGGDVTVTGYGGGGSSGSPSASSSTTNYGVFLEKGGYVTAGGTGTVRVNGTGGNTSTGATGGSNTGVYVDAFVLKGTNELYSTQITSGGGNIIINGTGGGKGVGTVNYGVWIKGMLKPTGSGTVSITGTGGPATGNSNYGVFIDGVATVNSTIYPATVTSEGGNITITGTGGGAGTSGVNYGVYLNAGGKIAPSGSGTVTVNGTGGTTTGSANYGVYVNGGTSPNQSMITSGGGNVSVTGTGPSQSSGTMQYGVFVSSAIISSGGNGNVSVTGTGGKGDVGTSGDGHIGIYVNGSTSSITSGGSGTVTVTGTGGGDGARTNNYGVLVSGTISSGGSGTVTVNGNGGTVATGAGQHGVKVSGSGRKITSGGGDVNINATEGNSSTSYAIALVSSGTITTVTNGGNITLKGNSFNTAAGCPVSAPADRSVTFIPLTSSTELQFTSAADEKGKIYLSTTDLATVTAGDIHIGNASTGLVTVSEAVTPPSGSNLTLSGSGLSPKLSGTEITMSAGKTLSVSGIPSVNIDISGTTVNTLYDQLKVVADLTLTGKTLTLSGAYTPIVGDVFTIVEATSISGIFSGLANGASITFNGKQLIVNYTATQVTLTAACTNPTSGGTIATAQTGSSPFDPTAFTSSAAATGQNGTLEYKWQLSTTSSSTGFTDIASSNSATYDPGSIVQTTWYKRLARVSCSSDWTGAAQSNVLEGTVVSSVTWNGSESTDWNTAANWTPVFVPTSTIAVNISSSTFNTPTLSSSAIITQLTVSSGNSLVLGAETITLTGNLTNSGTITSTSGKLSLAGTSAQTISGTGSIRNLEINNASGVVISAGSHMQTITGKLTPTAGTLTTNGNLTLRSNINGTARVGQGSASGGYIIGDVVTQRYLSLNNTGRNGRAWRLVTIPVTGTGTLRDVFMAGQSGTDLTVMGNRSAQPNDLGTVVIGHNQPDAATATGAGYDWIGVAGQVSSLRYYQQNATSGYFASSQVPSLSTTYTSAAQGYMLFARGDRRQTYNGTGNSSATVLQATGALKQGTVNITIPALASAGFVLVGNPYMAVLDLEKVILDNAGVIDNTVYVWDANIDGNAFKQGGYRAVTRTGASNWTITGTSITNPQYIESGSAFFVKPSSSGGTLSIKEAHKVDGTPGIAPHGSMTDGPSRLFINLEVTDTANRRLVDGAVAFFDTNYKDALGDVVDIAPMTNLTAGSITLRQSGVRLSMEGRPWPADSAARTIPVDMRNLGDDAYVLRILPTNMSKEGFAAWLKDRHLNQETSLKTADETLYPFRRTGDLGIDSSRFEIVYRLSKPTTPGTLTPDDAAGESGPRLYPNPAKSADVKLSLGSLAPGRYEVQVLDMSGRLVLTKTVEHKIIGVAHNILGKEKLASGLYTLILIDQNKQPKETLRLVVE